MRMIGRNTTANKFYHLNSKIGLDRLNLSFVHQTKFAKIFNDNQFHRNLNVIFSIFGRRKVVL